MIRIKKGNVDEEIKQKEMDIASRKMTACLEYIAVCNYPELLEDEEEPDEE